MAPAPTGIITTAALSRIHVIPISPVRTARLSPAAGGAHREACV